MSSHFKMILTHDTKRPTIYSNKLIYQYKHQLRTHPLVTLFLYSELDLFSVVIETWVSIKIRWLINQ